MCFSQERSTNKKHNREYLFGTAIRESRSSYVACSQSRSSYAAFSQSPSSCIPKTCSNKSEWWLNSECVYSLHICWPCKHQLLWLCCAGLGGRDSSAFESAAIFPGIDARGRLQAQTTWWEINAVLEGAEIILFLSFHKYYLGRGKSCSFTNYNVTGEPFRQIKRCGQSNFKTTFWHEFRVFRAHIYLLVSQRMVGALQQHLQPGGGWPERQSDIIIQKRQQHHSK